MSMESFLFALCSQRERRQKQLCEIDAFPRTPHPHLLLNKSVAMTTSREPQKAWRLPASVLLHGPPPRGLRSASDWATSKNTSPSWSQSLLNMATLAQSLLWLLQTCLWPRFVWPIGFHFFFGFWLWPDLLFTILWLHTKSLPRMPCPRFPVSAMTLLVLAPACLLWLMATQAIAHIPLTLNSPPAPIHPLSLPVTHLCWGYDNRWV